MGHRGHSEFRGRPYGPDPFGREAQDRTRIAQAAAKLIAEHGIADWTLAKRKAARQLMLPERTALPGDAEIEAALADYHALFGGAAHVAQLREQRERALLWMQRLGQFEPALVGGVAAGWATAHSDIRTGPCGRDREIRRDGLAQRRRRLPHDECGRRWSATNSRRHAGRRLAPHGTHARRGEAAAPPRPAWHRDRAPDAVRAGRTARALN